MRAPSGHSGTNEFKAALAAGKRQLGIWSALCSNLLAEMLGDAGFDWILFDTEHAPNDLQELIAQLQALRGTSVYPVVRPWANDPVAIKRLLDIGFRNLLIPFVQDADEARNAVASTRYPPNGIRGVSGYHRNNRYGADGKYFEYINEDIAVIVQIETPQAITALDEIASVSGLDAVFVGPGDLAASLGHIGNVRHPDVQQAIRGVGERARRLKIPAGIVAGTVGDAQRYLEWNFTFMTVGSDVALFRNAIMHASNSLKVLATP